MMEQNGRYWQMGQFFNFGTNSNLRPRWNLDVSNLEKLGKKCAFFIQIYKLYKFAVDTKLTLLGPAHVSVSKDPMYFGFRLG